MLGLNSIKPMIRCVRAASSLSLLKDKSFVNNTWVSAKDGKTFEVRNPANNNVIANVPDMTVEQLDDVVNVANSAFQKWKHSTARERSSVLKNWYRLLLENKEELAKIITLENGKPLRDSRTEVSYGADFVEWFAEEARRIYGDVIPPVTNQKRCITIKQPVGVAGMITPWNFPNAMITRKAAPAIAAGCTVIIKPSEETPLSALAICELALKAGFPEGVINVITCSKKNAASMGLSLCKHPHVSKISFTGSTAVGKILMENSASTVKRVSMELGGNAPFIIFNSADVEEAVKGVLDAKFRCSGQTCVCPNRLLVQQGIHEKFVSRLTEAVNSLKLGDGLEEETTQGPLINRYAVDKVAEHVKDAVIKGAKVVVGGMPKDDKSNFFQPTVLTNVSPNALCANEETFGPLAPIIMFENEEEAIRIANATSSGLAGYFYSNNISQIWRVAEAIEVGMIGINEGLISSVQTPFGGIKESGVGKEGSKYGIEEYLNMKYLCFGSI